MAGKSSSKVAADVREVKASKSKTAAELEAEIAATATEIGEKKTKKPVSPPAKPEVTEPESEGVSIVVKRKPASKPADEVKESEPTEVLPKIMGHKGRKIQPLSAEPTDNELEAAAAEVNVEAEVEPAQAETEQEVATETEEPGVEEVSQTEQVAADDVATEEKVEASNPDSAESSDAEHKLDAITGELEAKVATKAKSEEEKPQAAKIYDTKKYHVPIKVNRHHRKSAIPLWAQLLVLVAGIAGALFLGVQSDSIDIPFLESSETDTQQTEIINQSPSEEVASAPEAVPLFQYADRFNSGEISLEFATNGFDYSFSGSFIIAEQGEIIADFVGQSGRQKAADVFKNDLSSLNYSAISPYDDSRNVSFTPNPNLRAEVSDAALLGLNEIFAGPLNATDVVFAEELYNLNNKCSASRASFVSSLNSVKLTSSTLTLDLAALLDKYNELEPACTDDQEDKFVKILPDQLPVITYTADQTDSSVTITVTGTNKAVSKVLLSNLKLIELSDEQLEAKTLATDFSDMRLVDLSLLATCEQAAFKDYKAGDSISALANAASCESLE